MSSGWRSVVIRTGDGGKVPYGFGHDFRNQELWIVEVSSGRRLARIASDLTRSERELVGRLCRQAPVLADACREANARLAKATHPNAKALRQIILGALRGLEIPLEDESDKMRDI